MARPDSPAKLFPPQGIVGAKVRIRRFKENDISSRYLHWLNDKQLLRYSNQRHNVHDRETIAKYLKGFEGTDNLFLSIVDLNTDRQFGTMTVFVSLPNGTADVGILVGEQSVARRGVALESWLLVLDWLLNVAKMRKITAGCVAANIAMVRLMQSSGMHHEATKCAQEIIDGEPQDVVFYAKFAGT